MHFVCSPSRLLPTVAWLIGASELGKLWIVALTLVSWSACRSQRSEMTHTYDWPGAVIWGSSLTTSAVSGTSWSMAKSALCLHQSTPTFITQSQVVIKTTTSVIALLLVCAKLQLLVISSLLPTKSVWTSETALGILAVMLILAGIAHPLWWLKSCIHLNKTVTKVASVIDLSAE